jgi:prepilin-type N-terminal cleavage/methylation domain-containing protein
MNMSYRKSQAGFTLVEIAIVLVIIGLLLGGVLKGTELIENSKVKRAVGEINGITAALYAYQDRYQRLPGDDGNTVAILTARGGSWSNVSIAGNNNGVLVATLANTFSGNGEGGAGFWSHLRAAGFINGDPAATGATALPKNAFGGVMGITTQAVGNPTSPLSGKLVCLSQVPGKSASALDTQLDDGNGNTGKMRATLGTSGTNTRPAQTALAAAYSEDSEYTICTQM